MGSDQIGPVLGKCSGPCVSICLSMQNKQSLLHYRVRKMCANTHAKACTLLLYREGFLAAHVPPAHAETGLAIAGVKDC